MVITENVSFTGKFSGMVAVFIWFPDSRYALKVGFICFNCSF